MTGARRFGARCLGAAAGIALDRVLGEPPTALHPVAWFGSAMQAVEDRIWDDDRGRGAAHAAIGVAIGLVAGRVVRSTTAAVELCCAGRELRQVAAAVGRVTEAGDLDRAREELRSLVGRDPSGLDASGISAAVVESVAENSVDAVIAPLFWAVVAGAPGATAYRAVNTMDAMVGHRSDRYRNYGTAAARLDDAANWIPARLFVALVLAAAPDRARAVLGAVRRDAGAHPSPNAGVAEAAMAGALDVELGGPLRYGDRLEERPTLGSGPRPEAADVARAVVIAERVETIAAFALAAVGLVLLTVPPRSRP